MLLLKRHIYARYVLRRHSHYFEALTKIYTLESCCRHVSAPFATRERRGTLRRSAPRMPRWRAHAAMRCCLVPYAFQARLAIVAAGHDAYALCALLFDALFFFFAVDFAAAATYAAMPFYG